MALPKAIETIDAELTAWLPTMVAKQRKHLEDYKCFCPLPATHANPPDRARVAANSKKLNPRSKMAWGDLGLDSKARRWSAKVTVYRSQKQPGFAVTIEASVAGEVWRRVINFGHEKHRERPWETVK